MNDDLIKVPDIGVDSAEVIEVCVKEGDSIEIDDSLIVLESDKASMDVPAPFAGKISNIMLQIGDKVSAGSKMMMIVSDNSGSSNKKEESKQPDVANKKVINKAVVSSLQSVPVPDIGAKNVPVIEVCIKQGDSIVVDDPLVVLESDKATMEVPAPLAGVIKEVLVKEGEELSQGDLIAMIETTCGLSEVSESKPEISNTSKPVVDKALVEPIAAAPEPPRPSSTEKSDIVDLSGNKNAHAGPAVRKLAREFGVDLTQIKGTGSSNRVLKEDVQNYVKAHLRGGGSATVAPAMPIVDFSKWGGIETKSLNRLRQLAAQNFQRSWLNVPHVTQFDEADITELEAYRKGKKVEAQAKDTKLTPLPFILKACAHALKELPQFCASLSPAGDAVIMKKYINIGVAVDTADGLLVPVIKDVDQKGLWELACECIELAAKARNKKLKPDEMQGGCFTISSLGSIGGTSFTPIVNAPEVAILGISKAEIKPKWDGEAFLPRLMLPLCLSYDHRAINGAEAARFTRLLADVLSDLRELLF